MWRLKPQSTKHLRANQAKSLTSKEVSYIKSARRSNRPNSCYHSPFLCDDAEEAVVEGLGGLQGLKPRRFADSYVAAEAATYKASATKSSLMYGGAIRNQRKSFSYRDLKISNRR